MDINLSTTVNSLLNEYPQLQQVLIDLDPLSPTYLHVIATVQEIDPLTKATRFDEPVGIAFAGNEKAYVALSSENVIAVIDVATRAIAKRLSITAQDPRAIAVRGDRLFVIPFPSVGHCVALDRR